MPAGNFKKTFFLISIVLLFVLTVKAQKNNEEISLAQQLQSFYNISLLPKYFSNTIEAQTSSYDTTWGNNDGFAGTYSFVRKDKDSNLVIFDIKGAGVVNRIWTPTPAEDTLDFYIDDTLHAAFSIKYIDLFTNKIYPFVNPLCGNELGGYYCYLPIPFQTSCKIVCRAKQTQFHQIQYRLYPQGTTIKKFSFKLSAEEETALQRIADLWNKEEHNVRDFNTNENNILTTTKTIKLIPGNSTTIFSNNEGGRILAISFSNASAFEGSQKLVDIKITWDDEKIPAVYCPGSGFFWICFWQKFHAEPCCWALNKIKIIVTCQCLLIKCARDRIGVQKK